MSWVLCPVEYLDVLLAYIDDPEAHRHEPTTSTFVFNGNRFGTIKAEDRIAYELRQSAGNLLWSFGTNRDDVLCGVRLHVRECDDCLERYVAYLDAGANHPIATKGFVTSPFHGITSAPRTHNYRSAIQEINRGSLNLALDLLVDF